LGVEEVRWDRGGTDPAGEYTFLYGNENLELGTGTRFQDIVDQTQFKLEILFHWSVMVDINPEIKFRVFHVWTEFLQTFESEDEILYSCGTKL
jgi:hypothetical protein